MARPLLADPDFARKAREGRAESINTCIACNQACLDHIFQNKTATCLVNPRAGRELDWNEAPASEPKKLAVIGAGAAGINFAFNAAARGHRVTVFESQGRIGGQLLLARNVPGKTEFDEMLRYFAIRLAEEKVDLRLNARPNASELANGGYDAVVLATGVTPRIPEAAGIEHPMVLRYDQALNGERPIGSRVILIGAGAIAFDMVEYLLAGPPHKPPALEEFAEEYGLDISAKSAGGRIGTLNPMPAQRKVTLLQRSERRPGSSLALSTGWIRRTKAARFGVDILTGAMLHHIDDDGVHVTLKGKGDVVLPCDTVIVCAGQEPVRNLLAELHAIAPELPVHVIGGAHEAAELDAKRAIDQASRLAMTI